MPETSATITAAADALLRIVVAGESRPTAASRPIKARPFAWTDPTALPRRDALDVQGLTIDPIGTACQAELRRIGHEIHAAGGLAAMAEAENVIADMDPEHAGWRAVVLESAWVGIGGRAA